MYPKDLLQNLKSFSHSNCKKSFSFINFNHRNVKFHVFAVRNLYYNLNYLTTINCELKRLEFLMINKVIGNWYLVKSIFCLQFKL